MNDPYEFVPPFISPLTHDQHAMLGRIAILWGQIDMVLDLMLEVSMGISPKQRRTLIGEKPLGAKLDMLKAHIDDIQDADGQALALEFWDLANQTKTQRNRCFHGVWGLRCGKANEVYPASTHFKDGGAPVKAEQLPPLEKKLCKTARIGMDALRRFHEIFIHLTEPGATRLFHGEGEMPSWLAQWREQHPVDDHSLDHRHKPGMLPFLEKPV
ncbi:MAG: hypothetical protein ABIM50_04435 [Novosphingobium sp.]